MHSEALKPNRCVVNTSTVSKERNAISAWDHFEKKRLTGMQNGLTLKVK